MSFFKPTAVPITAQNIFALDFPFKVKNVYNFWKDLELVNKIGTTWKEYYVKQISLSLLSVTFIPMLMSYPPSLFLHLLSLYRHTYTYALKKHTEQNNDKIF